MTESGRTNWPETVPSGRTVLARLTTPTAEWQLQSRDSHYEIICNGVFLMASYNRASDRSLATVALSRTRGDRLRILVGGLGIGFTAQAALEDTRVAVLEVVEIEATMVAWHRTYFASLCGQPLDDPRTALVQADLVHLRLASGAYDAILLDTDNGPDWLVRDANARLYTAEAAKRFLTALRPGGVLAYWSASPSAVLADALASGGGAVEVVATEDQIAPGHPSMAWLYLVTAAVPTRPAGPARSTYPPI
jgi:spermidine synthase